MASSQRHVSLDQLKVMTAVERCRKPALPQVSGCSSTRHQGNVTERISPDHETIPLRPFPTTSMPLFVSVARHRGVLLAVLARYGQFFSVLAFTERSTVKIGSSGSVSQLGQIGVLTFLSPMKLMVRQCRPQNCISVTPRGAFKKRAPRPTHNKRLF
jgi:hypothetical protein